MPDIQLTYSAAQNHIFFDSEELGRFRFFPKGRRLGFTLGAGQAVIEWLLEGKKVLWGDTVSTNIDRYVSRYMEPVLKRNRIGYKWRKSAKELIIGKGHCDFRSADRPENWEGFGYDVVLLNEAGIILDDRYLFENAVMPMLMDNPNSTLIAGGTPKLRQGKGRLFEELCSRAESSEEYYCKRFSSYDNPFLDPEGIRTLEAEISQAERPQEIEGRFLQPGGSLIQRDWINVRRPPDKLRTAQGVDLAISLKQTADYTAVATVGMAENGDRYILDVQRRRLAFHAACQFIHDQWKLHNGQSVRIEDNQFQSAVVQELVRHTEMPVRGIRADRDKVTRAQRLIKRYENGVIYHAPGLPPEFVDELLAFPIGEHDDQVDAVVNADAALADVVHMDYQSAGPRELVKQGVVTHTITTKGWGTVKGDHDYTGY